MTDDTVDPTRPTKVRRPRPARIRIETDRPMLRTASLVIATIFTVVGVFSTWASVQALDTDAWATQSEELIADPVVQQAVATALVDELFTQLDIAGDLSRRLPEGLGPIALPLTVTLRSSAVDSVERLVASETVRVAWVSANRLAHATMVSALRGDDLPAFAVVDGDVVLQLGMLLRLAGEHLGLPGYLIDELPQDAGSVTVFRADELDAMRSVVSALDTLSWFSFVVAVALFGIAVYLSQRRLDGISLVGACLIGAGIVVLAVRSAILRRAVDSLVDNPTNEPAASFTGSVGTALVGQLGWALVVAGVLLVAVAALLGGHAVARRIRAFAAPVVDGSVIGFAAVTALVVLATVWWNPGGSLDRPIPALTIAAILIGGLVALRRTTPVPHGPKTNSRPPEGPRAEWG